MKLKKIIAQDAFFLVNKAIAKRTDNDSAILFSFFVEMYEYFEQKGELKQIDNEFYFYCTSEVIQEKCNIGYKTQKKCLEKLKDLGFINFVLKGNPARLYFTIIEENVWRFFEDDPQTAKQDLPKRQNKIYPNGKTRFTQTAKQDLPKRQNINKEINNKEITYQEINNNICENEIFASFEENSDTLKTENFSKKKSEGAGAIFKKMIDIFDKFYVESFNRKYQGYGGKEGKNLKSLIHKIKKEVIANEQTDYVMDVDSKILEFFEMMLQKMPKNGFVYKNLSISTLNQFFDQTVNEILLFSETKNRSKKELEQEEFLRRRDEEIKNLFSNI
jgi:hypothetical protein